MGMNGVRVESLDGGIVRVTLDRPASRNALDDELAEAIDRHTEVAAAAAGTDVLRARVTGAETETRTVQAEIDAHEQRLAGLASRLELHRAERDRLTTRVDAVLDGTGQPTLTALLQHLTRRHDKLCEACAAHEELRFAERDRLAAAAPPLDVDADERALRELIYRHGRHAVLDRLALSWAAPGAGDAQALRDRQAFVTAADVRPPPFTGAQIVAAGLPAGPEVGRLQKLLEAWWIAHDFKADKAEARAALYAAVAAALASQQQAGDPA